MPQYNITLTNKEIQGLEALIQKAKKATVSDTVKAGSENGKYRVDVRSHKRFTWCFTQYECQYYKTIRYGRNRIYLGKKS